MAQSAAHKFVTDTFIQVTSDLSKSNLFGYREADRSGFDFACMLERDRSRPLVGQTLTYHSEGIEKDLNWLLYSEPDEIPVYLYAKTTRNEARIREILTRARKYVPDRVSLIRLYSYPSDFDADEQSQRALMRNILTEYVAEDLLMKVVFGRLTATDVVLFLNGSGIPGLILACLESIATKGFFNFPALARDLGGSVSHSTVQPRVKSLVTAGMLDVAENASMYRVNDRGRAFLRASYLVKTSSEVNFELSYILNRLGLNPEKFHPVESIDDKEFLEIKSDPQRRLQLLWLECMFAESNFGVSISGGPYPVETPRDSSWSSADITWIGR